MRRSMGRLLCRNHTTETIDGHSSPPPFRRMLTRVVRSDLFWPVLSTIFLVCTFCATRNLHQRSVVEERFPLGRASPVRRVWLAPRVLWKQPPAPLFDTYPYLGTFRN